MEKYSKAVSEMHSQFKQRESNPMEEYIGRLASLYGKEVEVVGYSHSVVDGEPLLIVDASQSIGWTALAPSDVVFKKCEYYWYVDVDDLIDQKL